MGGEDAHIRRRRYRRRLRRHSRGVVAVVGTFMALLIFFALFGVFLTQYLPLWMTEDEEQLSSQIQQAMAQLKSNVDLQVSVGNPAVYSTPFPTVSQSIPLLTQPTTAQINFVPFTAGQYVSVFMAPGPGNPTNTPASNYTQNASLGRLVVQLPDRYYSPQTFSFESDAVIQSQAYRQQVLEFPPVLSFNSTGIQNGVSIQLIQLVGAATQSSGAGTQEVSTHYIFSQVVTSTSSTNNVSATYTIATQNACAWGNYLNTALALSGIPNETLRVAGTVLTGAMIGQPFTCNPPVGSTQTVSVSFVKLASLTLVFSEIRVVLGVGVE